MTDDTTQPDQGLGLAQLIESLRAELTVAMRDTDSVSFPIENVELVVNVGVTRSLDAKAGVKFWVVEAGGGGSWAKEEVQTITLTLGPPVDTYGRPISVGRGSSEKP